MKMLTTGAPGALGSARRLGSTDAGVAPSQLSDQMASRNGSRHSVYWVQSHRKASADGRKTSTTADMGAGAGHVEYSVTGKYTGEWQDGKKHGYGVFVYATGSKYEGEWVHDRREGKGTHWVGETDKSHKQYAGDWRHDKRHGMGTFFFEDGGRYDGLWERNKRQGAGRMVFSDRSIYEGQWLNNQRSGPGVLMLPNGDRYDGHWLNDKKEGPGRFYFKATRKIYEGEWVDGAPRCGTYHDDEANEGLDGHDDHDLEGDSPFKVHDRFHIPELGLAHPERVVSESVAHIRQERVMEKAFASTQLGVSEDRSTAHGGTAGEETAGSVVFDAATMQYLQQEFQSIERRDGTIQCETLPQMLATLGIRVDNDQLLAFLDEISATPETSITFAECIDILSLLAESTVADGQPQDEDENDDDDEEQEDED